MGKLLDIKYIFLILLMSSNFVLGQDDEYVKGKEYICLNLTGVNGGPLLVENEQYNYKVYNKVQRKKDEPQEEVEQDPENPSV